MNLASFLFKFVSIILFVALLLVGFDKKQELWEIFLTVKMEWFFLGIMFYFCNYVSRSYRLYLLTNGSSSSSLIYFKTASLHGFYAYFLPFRSGDFALPFLLNKYSSLPLVSGSAILIKARFLDLISLGVLLFVACLLSFEKLNTNVLFLFLSFSVGLIVLPYFIQVIVRKGVWAQSIYVGRLFSEVDGLTISWKELICSLIVWFWVGCTFYSVIKAQDIPIQFIDIWFLVAIQLPLQLLPIQGVASAGNHEVGWVMALALFGISPSVGLEFAVAAHMIIIVYVVVLGVVGFSIPFRISKKM